MEPTLGRTRQTDSKAPPPSVGGNSSRDILKHSLKIFSDHLNTSVIPGNSFWVRYDVQTGALMSVHESESFDITSTLHARGRHIRFCPRFKEEGIPIRYRVGGGITPLTFYIPMDESPYIQNVKAFEMALNALSTPRDRPETLQDMITPGAIDKLLRAKAQKGPARFRISDPLSIMIYRSRQL